MDECGKYVGICNESHCTNYQKHSMVLNIMANLSERYSIRLSELCSEINVCVISEFTGNYELIRVSGFGFLVSAH